MTWNSVMSWVVHRRAVVSGFAVDARGLPYTGAACLSLNAEPPGRRFACHMRSDGRFFFLDVPPGRYALERSDDSGQVVQTEKVVVAPYESSSRMPSVQVDLEVAAPGRTSE